MLIQDSELINFFAFRVGTYMYLRCSGANLRWALNWGGCKFEVGHLHVFKGVP